LPKLFSFCCMKARLVRAFFMYRDVRYTGFAGAKTGDVHGCIYTAIAWMRRSGERAAYRRNQF